MRFYSTYLLDANQGEVLTSSMVVMKRGHLLIIPHYRNLRGRLVRLGLLVSPDPNSVSDLPPSFLRAAFYPSPMGPDERRAVIRNSLRVVPHGDRCYMVLAHGITFPVTTTIPVPIYSGHGEALVTVNVFEMRTLHDELYILPHTLLIRPGHAWLGHLDDVAVNAIRQRYEFVHASPFSIIRCPSDEDESIFQFQLSKPIRANKL